MLWNTRQDPPTTEADPAEAILNRGKPLTGDGSAAKDVRSSTENIGQSTSEGSRKECGQERYPYSCDEAGPKRVQVCEDNRPDYSRRGDMGLRHADQEAEEAAWRNELAKREYKTLCRISYHLSRAYDETQQAKRKAQMEVTEW